MIIQNLKIKVFVFTFLLFVFNSFGRYPDTLAPAIISVIARTDPHKVVMSFDDELERATAQNVHNYKMCIKNSAVSISKALLTSDKKKVTLNLNDSLVNNCVYSLRIINLLDTDTPQDTILDTLYIPFTYTTGVSLSRTVNILPLGNSITWDNDSIVSDPRPVGARTSYRYKLSRLLDSAGYKFHFIGNRYGGYDSFPEAHVCAYPGSFDYSFPSLIRDGVLNFWSSQRKAPGPFLHYYPADIVLIELGTNQLDTSSADISELLDAIDEYEQTEGKPVVTVLSRIINQKPYNATVTAFNNNIENMARKRIAEGDRVIVVDMEKSSGFNYVVGDDMLDGVHPNAKGYAKMAQVWFRDALDPLMKNKPIVRIVNPFDSVSIGPRDTLTIQAGAFSLFDTIRKVEFFFNGALAGSDNTVPYSVSYVNFAPGTYSVRALAISNDKDSSWSNIITVIRPWRIMPLGSSITEETNADTSYSFCKRPVSVVSIIQNGSGSSESNQVAIIPGTAGSVVRYTVDGTVPKRTSALYRAPITIGAHTMVQAQAYSVDNKDSSDIARSEIVVTNDNSSPRVLSASASDSSRLTVLFDEPLDIKTAGNYRNYTVSGGIIVTSASLQIDRKRVVLSVSKLISGNAYTVTVSGVKDCAPGKNIVASNSQVSFIYTSGSGLNGSYYTGQGFDTFKKTEIDTAIDFNWTTNPFGSTAFCVRWTGMIRAPYSGIYRFTLSTTSGARLWIDCRPMVDRWKQQYEMPIVASISLLAGQRYPIVLEYLYNNTGTPMVKFQWECQGIPRQVVPKEYLEPSSNSAPVIISTVPVFITEHKLFSNKALVVQSSVKPVWKIMCLGNSITEAGDNKISYRCWLWRALKDRGANVNFVGSRTGVFAGYSNAYPKPPKQMESLCPYDDFDEDHEGHTAWKVDELLYGSTNGTYGYPGKLGDWARSTRPDIVLLHGGTNDVVFQGEQATEARDDLSKAIDTLQKVNPRVIILLAQIIPTTNSNNTKVSALNALLPALANQKSTSKAPVMIVDQNTGFNASTDCLDGVHPNTVGEQKMAERWYDALKGFIAGSPFILSHRSLTIKENRPIKITLDNFTVIDIDGTYPKGFTINIQPGSNYSVSGSTVTPSLNYRGLLSVALTVSDGKGLSNTFSCQITVTAEDEGSR